MTLTRPLRAGLLAVALAAVTSPGGRPVPAGRAAVVAAPIDVGPEIASFYRERDHRPLWVEGRTLRPAAQRLLASLDAWGARDAALTQALAAAESDEPDDLARADLLLSQAYAGHLAGLRRPPARDGLRHIDSGLRAQAVAPGAALAEAAAAPSLDEHLRGALAVNPALAGLTRGLDTYRRRWSGLPQLQVPAGLALTPGASGSRVAALRRRLGLGSDRYDAALAARVREFQRVHALEATGRADAATIAALNRGAAHYEWLILANIERARAIPAHARYIIVDAASARLWMVEHGRIAGSMRVIVGKQAMQTPAMAGLIRYAVLNPYWNLPPDLIRERARKGVRGIRAERLEVLSDWGPRPRRLDPARVDWRAIARGRRLVNLRQTPGPHNMMGRVKFMMPNDLGVYLHDTPLRHFFVRADRRISSGCVRLEDAQRLGRWLFGGRMPTGTGAAEQRVDLPEAVPVYITYLTALPERGEVVFHPDRYGRDGPQAQRPARAQRGVRAASRRPRQTRNA